MTWQDEGWAGVPQKDLVFYELHVGTFTPEGTYEGVRQKLPYLKDLGVTAIELLPLADFPGRWNWGYDPAAFFAPSRAYGTPEELRRLVDEAHAHGLAVYLDVVYNHFGPDGAYPMAYSPYIFTNKHHTPWGQAINLDGEGAERACGVFSWRTPFTGSPSTTSTGFRLDAVFALIDDSPQHFLAELTEAAESVPGPRRILVAEDHRNTVMDVLPRDEGGLRARRGLGG